ncbi:TetR/AcrR family transcriptional regulator [Xanthomonas medicagonis]|uniref:TetR/AcrR family transcriptional regulator n=1 Tax=Xanthomonas medicagonis TaxID=3160841 RepID=UPI0035152225
MSTDSAPSAPPRPARPRLAREDRHRQLLDVAWRLVRDEGTDALTLGRLAEQAGVTKPVVYDHFQSREGLLAALYLEYDARQSALLDAALAASEPTLASRARVIASSYVGCVMTQGRELPGVAAALVGSPALEKVKRDWEVAFLDKCRSVLGPFARGHTIAPAALRAMLGAADALSYAAAAGEVSAEDAQQELFVLIVAMVERSRAAVAVPAAPARARKRP